MFQQHATHLEVAHARQHGALHDGAALVVLDVAHPHGLVQCDFFREPLFLKVTNSVVIGIGQEMHDIAGGFHIVLQMGHEMRPVALNLLVAADGAEDDLGELAALERPVCDASHYLEGLLDDGYGQVGSVVDESRDVIFGHLGKLFLEDALQTGEYDEGFPVVVIVYHPKLDLAGSFFDDGGLVKGPC